MFSSALNYRINSVVLLTKFRKYHALWKSYGMCYWGSGRPYLAIF